MVYESEGKEYTIAEIDVLSNGKYKLPLITLKADSLYNDKREKEVEITYVRNIEPKLSKETSLLRKLEQLFPIVAFYKEGVYFPISKLLDKGTIEIRKPFIDAKSPIFQITYRPNTVENPSLIIESIMDFHDYVVRVALPNLKEDAHPLYLSDLYSEKEEKRIRSNLEEALKKIREDFKL